jgi:hypothetical protein
MLLFSPGVFAWTDLLGVLNSPIEPSVSCETAEKECPGVVSNSLSPEKKSNGWVTLIEIKYQSIAEPQLPAAKSASFSQSSQLYYSSNPETDLLTADGLNAEVARATAWFREHAGGWSPSEEDLLNDIMFRQLRRSANNDDLMARIKTYSSALTDDEYLKFMSSVADWIQYDYGRAAFDQGGPAKGRRSAWDLIAAGQGGICGDIHSATAKLAEQRGWEAFTVGYTVGGSQHVVTAAVDPKNPNLLRIVNYGRYEEQTLNDANSVSPVPTASMRDIGLQYRIFKNTRRGGDGQMQQIATIPTALGTFMSDLFVKENQIAAVMPKNENSRREDVRFRRESQTVEEANGKITEKTVGKDVVIYEGETDNAQIFGVAVSRDTFKNMYRWDEAQQRCVLKQSKYFTFGGAASIVNFKQDGTPTTFYAYLNMKGAKVLHLYETEFFQFKGILGYELDGHFSGAKRASGDGNLKGLAGVMADYQKKGLKLHIGLRLETNLGLRDQNLMTDLAKLPTNLDPFRFNALALDLSASKSDGKQTLFTKSELTMTRVGGRVFLSTGIIKNNTTLMLSYQGGVRAVPIGNSLQSINLLQNMNGPDGLRLSIGQSFQGKVSGSVSGWGGLTTSGRPIAGGTLKINLGGNKKRAPARGPSN